MGRVKPYESQVSSQGDLPARNAGVADFGGPGQAQFGQEVESLGADLGQIQRFQLEQQARQDVTQAHVEHAQIVTQLTDDADARGKTWKLGDPSISEQMVGVVKNRMDSFIGGDEGSRFETAAGEETAKQLAAQTSSHILSITRQMDAKLAGAAAEQQLRTATDTMGNFVYSHPAHINKIMGDAEQLLRDRNGVYAASRIGQSNQDKLLRDLQEQLAVQAVKGMTKLFPNRALQVLQQDPEDREAKYAYIQEFVPNEKMQELVGHAERAVNAHELEARQMEAEVRRQHAEMQETTAGKLTGKFLLNKGNPGNPNFPPLSPTEVGELANNGDLKDGDARALWGLIDTNASGQHAPKTNWDAYWKMSNRIHGLNGETKLTSRTPILELGGIARQIAPTDMERLLKQYDDTKDPQGQRLAKKQAQFMASMKSSIDTSIVGKKLDSRGRELYGEFEALVQDKVEEYKEQGKSPWPLFDKNSPDYLGLIAQQPPYQRSFQEQIEEVSKKLQEAPTITEQGSTPPDKQRKPGEDAQQYLKRTQ